MTGRVAGLSRKSNMDICSYPTGSSVNHVAIDLTLFLCACYNADMLPTYPYMTCQLDIVSTLADTIFGCVANMSANMLATCRADTHVSVDSTIFSTFENPTFPAKTIVPLPQPAVGGRGGEVHRPRPAWTNHRTQDPPSVPATLSNHSACPWVPLVVILSVVDVQLTPEIGDLQLLLHQWSGTDG
jgi:hypothetical protein